MSRVWTPSLWTGPPGRGARAYLRRTRGAGGAFSPSDLGGLQLWLEADAIGGLNDGDAVATWEDSSAANNDLTQGTAGSRPTYQTNEVNSLPVVRFVTDDVMTNAGLSVSRRAFSLFMVTKSNDAGVQRVYADFTGNLAYQHLSGRYQLYDGTSVVNSNLLVPAGFACHAVVGDAAGSTFRLNGTTASTAVFAAGTLTGFFLGRFAAGGFFLHADVAEVVLYNVALGTTDQESVEDYLMTKYGL